MSDFFVKIGQEFIGVIAFAFMVISGGVLIIIVFGWLFFFITGRFIQF